MAPPKLPTTKDIIDLTSSPTPSPSPSPQPQQQILPMNRADEDNNEDEDEDLKLAIALSLQQHKEEKLRYQDCAQDHEHTDSLVPTTRPEVLPQPSSPTMTQRQPHPQPSQPLSVNPTNGLQGLDRRAMEAERLARLKRKRDASDEGILRVIGGGNRISPPPLSRPPSKAPSTQASSTGSITVHGVSSSSTARSSSSSAPTPTTATTYSSFSSPQMYPHGKVFKTTTPADASSPSTMSFPSLLHPASTLQSALLSSFTISFDWLLPHFSTHTTSFLFVLHAPTLQHRSLLTSDFHGIPNVQLCFPPMDGNVNCMHSKLILLFWNERCRIVVPTGNLVPYDWGGGAEGKEGEEEGWMENMVWVIDLLRLPSSSTSTGNTTATMTKPGEHRNGYGNGKGREETDFQRSLSTFLRASTVPESVIQKLSRYDFSKTQDVRFVHSIGGSHTDSSTWRNTGHPGLGRAISSLGLATKSPISVDFVTSSLGSLNNEFMRSIYLACQGDDGLTEYTLRNAKKLPSKRLGASGREAGDEEEKEGGVERQLVKKEDGSDWKDNFRVYFPSHSTVLSSKAGPGGAGTICFSRKWWENAKFPRRNMRDCVSVREGLLMHNKIIFVRIPVSSPKKGECRRRRCEGWTYVGSGNLSESAWGRLVQDITTKKHKLNCRNWECGVVIPVFATDGPGSVPVNDEKESNLEIFASTIPIPMLTPGVRYEASTKQPWFFGE